MYTYTVHMDSVIYILKSVILFNIENTAKGRPRSSTNMRYTSNRTIDLLRN